MRYLVIWYSGLVLQYEWDGVGVMSGTNVAAKSRPTSLADSLVYLHSKHAKFGGWWLTILNSSCIR
jgi:hypothetical protein